MLKVRNLSISFETENGIIHAVRNISFDLPRGETLGVVGESGCGKSITNLALLGLLPPEAKVTADELSFDDINLINLNEKQWSLIRGKKIGIIFQDPMSALNPSFTIGKQISEAISLYNPGASKESIRSIAVDLLTQVGIPDPQNRLSHYPHEMSGGMAQRVMIAMAISGHPKLLIADEPTTALDVTIQLQILKLLREIQKKNNMSILLVTHDLGVVGQVSNNIQVLYAGEIVEKAPTAQLLENPLHPYTKGLLDALPSHHKSSGDELYTIPGIVPNLKDRKKGCQFAPRCSFATDQCNNIIQGFDKIENRYAKCIYPLTRESQN